jgi:hypothetical protein
VGSEKQRLCSHWPPRDPGNRGRSSAIPARPWGAGSARRPGYRAFFLGTRIEEAPHARPVGARWSGSAHKPTTPTSQRLTSPHLRVLGRCLFSPLLRPYSPGGAKRGSHTGQFSCFGPRSCFIAFVLDIPNGVWPLNKAVGRAYIRETVPIQIR